MAYQGHASTSEYPPSHTGPASESSGLRRRRRRADAAQLKFLNDMFNHTPFPNTDQRAELAVELGLSPRQVQIWLVFSLSICQLHFNLHNIEGFRARERKSGANQVNQVFAVGSNTWFGLRTRHLRIPWELFPVHCLHFVT